MPESQGALEISADEEERFEQLAKDPSCELHLLVLIVAGCADQDPGIREKIFQHASWCVCVCVVCVCVCFNMLVWLVFLAACSKRDHVNSIGASRIQFFSRDSGGAISI